MRYITASNRKHIDHDWKPLEEIEYVVQRIINTRLNNYEREYEVLWEGYTQTTWETVDKFSNCMAIFNSFLEENYFKVSK